MTTLTNHRALRRPFLCERPMSNQLDPQITSAAIQGGAGLVTGILGTAGAWWRWGRGGRRCEQVCANMVAVGDTMLAVMKALGADDPRLLPHVLQMEAKLNEARTFLGGV